MWVSEPMTDIFAWRAAEAKRPGQVARRARDGRIPLFGKSLTYESDINQEGPSPSHARRPVTVHKPLSKRHPYDYTWAGSRSAPAH